MTNDVMIPINGSSSVSAEDYQQKTVRVQNFQANEDRMCKFVGEVIGAAKDDRTNTKRAISADIASAARVQNQNDRVIAACEKELQRKDLSEDSREELIRCMSKAAESTSDISKASREFQREQLNHSHNIPLEFIGIGMLIFVGGVGGWALIKATA